MAVTICATSGSAQSPSPPSSNADQIQDRTAVVFASRVARLAAQFESLREPTASERAYANGDVSESRRNEAEAASTRRDELMNGLAARIHREVDDFIAQAVTPVHLNREFVESRLRVVLAAASSEPPAVVITEENGPRLAIAYSLFKAGIMGEGGTSVSLRMYVERKGHLVVSDATGSDMDGYAQISVTELHSPAPREAWFLLSGRLTGANGPNTRMCIYAYDGQRFRTVWRPENVWGDFTIVLGDGGFTVKGTYYRGGARDERYAITPTGVYRLPDQ